MGDDKFKTIYKDVNADHHGGSVENCGLLQRWVSEKYIKDWSNTIIVVPKNVWCSQSNDGIVEMIQGKLFDVNDPTLSRHRVFAIENERRAFL